MCTLFLCVMLQTVSICNSAREQEWKRIMLRVLLFHSNSQLTEKILTKFDTFLWLLIVLWFSLPCILRAGYCKTWCNSKAIKLIEGSGTCRVSSHYFPRLTNRRNRASHLIPTPLKLLLYLWPLIFVACGPSGVVNHFIRFALCMKPVSGFPSEPRILELNSCFL